MLYLLKNNTWEGYRKAGYIGGAGIHGECSITSHPNKNQIIFVLEDIGLRTIIIMVNSSVRMCWCIYDFNLNDAWTFRETSWMAYGGHFAQSQPNNKPVQCVLFNKENLVIIDMVKCPIWRHFWKACRVSVICKSQQVYWHWHYFMFHLYSRSCIPCYITASSGPLIWLDTLRSRCADT